MDAPDNINPKPKISLKLTHNFGDIRQALTFHSSLGSSVSSMLSLNSVASVAQEVAANAGIIPVRSPVQPVDALAGRSGGQAAPQRSLEAVPPEPSKPLPRGSLLDLRV
jgi:hypothetical protein